MPRVFEIDLQAPANGAPVKGVCWNKQRIEALVRAADSEEAELDETDITRPGRIACSGCRILEGTSGSCDKNNAVECTAEVTMPEVDVDGPDCEITVPLVPQNGDGHIYLGAEPLTLKSGPASVGQKSVHLSGVMYLPRFMPGTGSWAE